MNKMHASPLKQTELRQHYDLLIGAVGYESRARFAFDNVIVDAASKWVIRFDDRQLHDFRRNELFFAKANFEVIGAGLPSIAAKLRNMVAPLEGSPQGLATCLVDISSMTRSQIATICYELYLCSRIAQRELVVDFMYSFAAFTPPSKEFGPIRFRGPVIPQLGGWTAEPDLPIALVFGIGYEKDIALGLTEEIEPTDLLVFRPTGHDPRYDQAIDSQNCDFLDRIPQNRILTYDIYDPFGLYSRLINVISGFQRDRRTTIVPLGPKMFSLCSILCGMEWIPSVSVWRVSAAEFGEPTNRTANGKIGCLRMSFGIGVPGSAN